MSSSLRYREIRDLSIAWGRWEAMCDQPVSEKGRPRWRAGMAYIGAPKYRRRVNIWRHPGEVGVARSRGLLGNAAISEASLYMSTMSSIKSVSAAVNWAPSAHRCALCVAYIADEGVLSMTYSEGLLWRRGLSYIRRPVIQAPYLDDSDVTA